MAADFEVEKTSMYIQDKWFVNNDLTVMFGLRYDAVETPIAPATNVNFVKDQGPKLDDFNVKKFLNNDIISFTEKLHPVYKAIQISRDKLSC